MKLFLLLGWKLAKYKILETVMEEFISRGLDKKYAKEIEEWQKYMDGKKFAIKLDKQMKEEIERFQKTVKKWTPEELKEFVIEGLL